MGNNWGAAAGVVNPMWAGQVVGTAGIDRDHGNKAGFNSLLGNIAGSPHRGQSADDLARLQGMRSDYNQYQNPHVIGGDRSLNRVNAFTDPFLQGNHALLDQRVAEARQAGAGFRAGQADLVRQLQNQIAGKGQSVAEIQMRQATDRNLSNQAGLIASMGGNVSPGAAQAMLARQQADIAGQAAGQGALLRAQEQATAREQLGGVLGQGRGQDLMGEQLVQQYTQQGMSLDQAQFLANQEMEKLITGERSGNKQLGAARRGQDIGLIGGGASGGGAMISALAASDERLKTDIKDGEKDVREFLSKIGAHSYRYKDEKHGKGTFVSPMAQELERTKLGKAMVVETPEGKMVDYGKGFGAILAATAALNRKVAEIEGRRGKEAA